MSPRAQYAIRRAVPQTCGPCTPARPPRRAPAHAGPSCPARRGLPPAYSPARPQTPLFGYPARPPSAAKKTRTIQTLNPSLFLPFSVMPPAPATRTPPRPLRPDGVALNALDICTRGNRQAPCDSFFAKIIAYIFFRHKPFLRQAAYRPEGCVCRAGIFPAYSTSTARKSSSITTPGAPSTTATNAVA